MDCWNERQRLSPSVNWSLLFKHVATACRHTDNDSVSIHTDMRIRPLEPYRQCLVKPSFAVAAIVCYASRELSRFALSVEISLEQLSSSRYRPFMSCKSCTFTLSLQQQCRIQALTNQTRVPYTSKTTSRPPQTTSNLSANEIAFTRLDDIHFCCMRLQVLSASEIHRIGCFLFLVVTLSRTHVSISEYRACPRVSCSIVRRYHVHWLLRTASGLSTNEIAINRMILIYRISCVRVGGESTRVEGCSAMLIWGLSTSVPHAGPRSQ